LVFYSGNYCLCPYFPVFSQFFPLVVSSFHVFY
jgi:hypothetical protein